MPLPAPEFRRRIHSAAQLRGGDLKSFEGRFVGYGIDKYAIPRATRGELEITDAMIDGAAAVFSMPRVWFTEPDIDGLLGRLDAMTAAVAAGAAIDETRRDLAADAEQAPQQEPETSPGTRAATDSRREVG